jgi:ribonuclease VapC
VNAWRRFGRGRHPAALNFRDCLTHAVAKLAAQPLLCVGDDFRQTDLDLVELR